jgi:hypothetical protein
VGITFKFPAWLKGNWFFVAAAFVLASDILALQTPNWSSPRLLEIGLLSDLAIVVPGLYIACYWRKGKPAVLRAIALASLGFWSASKLLPEAGQVLIPSLWPVRYAALAVLMVIEFKVLLSMYRSVFGGASRHNVAESLQAQTGMPPWAAKLAAAEAAIWHAAYTKVKAIFRCWRS